MRFLSKSLLVVLIAVLAVDAGATCQSCSQAGSTWRDTSRWPYNEHIADGIGNAYQDIVVYYNNWAWKTIQSSCLINTTQPVDTQSPANMKPNVLTTEGFHAFARNQTTIIDATVPAGTLYESQLVLTRQSDPTYELVMTWDQRRVRYDSGTAGAAQVDHGGATLENISPAPYNDYILLQRVRIIDNVAGYLKFHQQWTTTLGVPSSEYPSQSSTYTGNVTVGTSWIAVGNTINIAQVPGSIPLDLAIVANGSISSGTAGQGIQIGFAIDDASSGSQNGNIRVPQTMPEGFTAFDYKVNVSRATSAHTLKMYMRATSGTITITNPSFSYVAYANSKALNGAEAEIRPTTSGISTTLQTVSSTTCPAEQPQLGFVNDGNGCWTKILTLPHIDGGQAHPDGNTAMTTLVNGYIGFGSNLSGNGYGQLLIQAVEHFCCSADAVTDLGIMDFVITNPNDGAYFSTDGIWSNFSETQYGNDVTIWARKVTPIGGQGEFQVSKIFAGLKFLPSPTCNN
jgi:hypothetical protein